MVEHERLAWALMQAVNNIHRYFVGDMLYSAEEIRDISRKLVVDRLESQKRV